MSTSKKPSRGGKSAQTTPRKKKTASRSRPSRSGQSTAVLEQPPALPESAKVEAVVPAAPPPSKPANAPPPVEVSDFSAGIFDVETHVFEPQSAPARSFVEEVVEDEHKEPLVVEPDEDDHLAEAREESVRLRDRRAEPRSRQDEPQPADDFFDDAPLEIEMQSEAEPEEVAPPYAHTASESTTEESAPAEGRGRRRRGSRGRRGGRRGREEEPAEREGEAAAETRAPRAEPARRERRGFSSREERNREPAADWDDRAVGEDTDRYGRDEEAEADRELGAASEPVDTARREMLINVSDSDEVRIALLRDGRLDELYIERAANISNVGNIYKGRVTNVEPSIQAAFIDFGLPMQGFLHISDLHPNYFPESKGEPELVGRKTPRRARPPIQNCLRRGQEVIVQVIKEGVGTKGPTLSTYVSLPGRFLVMMPGMDQLGVSRKIEDEETRRKVRGILNQLSLPKGFGFIVRTAGIDRNRKDLQRDLNYLCRLWDKVQVRIKKEPAPATLYKESDLVIRTIRDVYDSNYQKIIVDNPTVAARVREFLQIASPNAEEVVELYDEPKPLFHRHGIESEIDKLYSKHVPLPCGGSLVIEQTEALVAIDVNSGRFRVHDNPEETAFRVNMEAADEIARQLRLRDLGGLIICDFIDMMVEKHKRTVERRLSDALRKHKERAKLLRISRFGILEMTRQRQRPSFAKSMFMECPRCSGSGRVKATETVALDVMRDIRLASQRDGVASIDVTVCNAVADDLLNRKRHYLTDLERAKGHVIRIHPDPMLGADEVRISCTDRRGREVVATGNADTTGRPATAPPAAGSRPPQGQGTGGRTDGQSGGGGRRGGRRRRGRGR